MLGFVVKEFAENLIAKAARPTGYQNGLVADHFRDGRRSLMPRAPSYNASPNDAAWTVPVERFCTRRST